MSKQSNSENHSDQLNPNNDAFWQSRGWGSRPEDWEDRVENEEEIQKELPNQSKQSR